MANTFDLATWLASVHPVMPKYAPLLIEHGFHDLDMLQELTQEICEKIRIPIGNFGR